MNIFMNVTKLSVIWKRNDIIHLFLWSFRLLTIFLLLILQSDC